MITRYFNRLSVAILTAGAVVLLASGVQPQEGVRYTKRVEAPLEKVQLGDRGDLTVRCAGLSLSDLVNIYVGDEAAVNGLVIVRDEAFPRTPESFMAKSMDPIPRSWLVIEKGLVEVHRPATADGTLLLLVKAPAGTNVSLSINGRTVASAPLRDNLAFWKGRLGRGFKPNEAVMRVMYGDLPVLKDVRPPSRPGEPYRAPFSVMRPKLRKLVMPERHAGLGTGTITTFITVDETGQVADVIPLGPPEFVDPAVSALRQWEFEPLVVNGQPVRVKTVVTFEFSREGVALTKEKEW